MFIIQFGVYLSLAMDKKYPKGSMTVPPSPNQNNRPGKLRYVPGELAKSCNPKWSPLNPTNGGDGGGEKSWSGQETWLRHCCLVASCLRNSL